MDRSSTSSAAATSEQAEREWWLRTVLVLQAPRPVFAALRDDDREQAATRSEPVLLIVLLSGIALALASTASRRYHGLDLAVWLFLGGGMTGIAAYWGFGALLYGAGRALGSRGSYRRARHVLAFACVPLALALAVAPAGRHVYSAAWFAFVAWATVLLVVGVRSVHAWTWQRAAVAAAVPVAGVVALLQLG
jgi:hypothetical protein